MAELNERDAKLVQYLSEAFGKEKELEKTKAHAKALERRIQGAAAHGPR